MSARAGIVVTGTEVLTGRVLDRNGPWLSERLREAGVDCAQILIVGDRPQDLRAALESQAALGLDSKMLVEEYKQRFERPGPQDLLPFHPRGARRHRRAWAIPPFVIVGLCVVALLAALYGLGTLGGDSNGDAERAAEATATPTATATPEKAKKKGRKRAAPTVVRLRIVPTGVVNVCLVSGVSGKVLINSQNLQPGETTRTFTAKRLRVTFGNGAARMRVGGKTYGVRDASEPVGYDLRPGRRPRALSASARPTCEG